ncbi:hypothetical protein CNMCM5793_005906 [Aspergillus hiratsukae]|uniref:Uncharacterized protein n=1 Tax=Aspergillus hiratsukae TaxID=1194566 RepID=A0A8H6PL92_9EURO|nr:hypothetical protein CNMCM5793_005906 [Aspergillus hiratsukae]KAF7156638.1 hypothetical protein CNMCM6106_000928 [Aspergillus hiratsukae]
MPIYIPLAPPRLQTEFNYNYNCSYNATQWNDPGQTTQFPGYDSDDEEEVVYDLDEHAMACLPHHLQQVMRELHMERLERLQRENPYFKFRSPVAYNRNSHANAWLDRVVSQLVDRQSMQRAGHHQSGETPAPDVLPQQVAWGENQTPATAERQHILPDTANQAQFVSRTLPQQMGWGQHTLGDTIDQTQFVSRTLGQQMGWGESQTQATVEPQHTLGDTANQTQFAFRTPETELAYHHEEMIADAGVKTEHNSSPIQEYFAERDDKSQTRIKYATWYGGQILEERLASADSRRRRSSIILEMRSRLQKKIGRMSRFFKRYSVP